MALTKEVKQELIGQHGRNETDTGSPEVQIAMLTRRIAGFASRCHCSLPKRSESAPRPAGRPGTPHVPRPTA